MVSSIHSLLVGYLASPATGSNSATATTSGKLAAGTASAATLSPAALQRAAASTKHASAIQALETRQQQLATDLRTALNKAGIKLTGSIEFSVKSDGSVDVKGSAADKAAVQSFLKADASQPSLASRIAGQAREALQLSATLQQSAAISQAAKAAKSASGVMALYTSLMQQSATSSVSFAVSATGSSLTYPGSLAARA